MKPQDAEIFKIFPDGLPCHSNFLPESIQRVKGLLTRKSEVHTKYCYQDCPKPPVSKVMCKGFPQHDATGIWKLMPFVHCNSPVVQQFSSAKFRLFHKIWISFFLFFFFFFFFFFLFLVAQTVKGKSGEKVKVLKSTKGFRKLKSKFPKIPPRVRRKTIYVEQGDKAEVTCVRYVHFGTTHAVVCLRSQITNTLFPYPVNHRSRGAICINCTGFDF